MKYCCNGFGPPVVSKKRSYRPGHDQSLQIGIESEGRIAMLARNSEGNSQSPDYSFD